MAKNINNAYLSDINKMSAEERTRHKTELREKIDQGKTSFGQKVKTAVSAVVGGVLSYGVFAAVSETVRSGWFTSGVDFRKALTSPVSILVGLVSAIYSARDNYKAIRHENDQNNSIKLAHIERLEHEEGTLLENKINQILEKRTSDDKLAELLREREGKNASERVSASKTETVKGIA